MIDSNLVLSTPEADQVNPVAPGQENLLEEFIAEQEAAQRGDEQQKILGKFNSPEDLAKAYQELEKKLGQPAQQAADPADPLAPQGYTRDQAVEIYGQGAVDQLAEKGVDLADLMWKADSGVDISSSYDDLAAAFNVPRQVVENYVSKAKGGDSAPAGDGLSADDVAAIKAMVGGEQQFNALSQWAAGNLDPQELADYNAVVDSGNKDAIRWALKAMQSRAAGTTPAEPKLIGGGRPPEEGLRFESKQQVLDAMNKRNDKGQKLYEVDEAYRQKFLAILERSEVFQ